MDEENKQQTPVKSGSAMVWILIVAVVVVIAGAAFYFLAPSNKSVNSDSATQGAENNAAEASPTAMVENTVKQITVEGGEFTFTPSAINVTKGDTVELTFKNTGKYPHDYVITDLGVKTKTLKPGEQDTVTFVADKTGSFDFICSVGDHEEKGMVGKLTVE